MGASEGSGCGETRETAVGGSALNVDANARRASQKNKNATAARILNGTETE